jgi:hypothetical protein
MRSTTVLEEQEALPRDCAKPVMGIYTLFTFCPYASPWPRLSSR